MRLYAFVLFGILAILLFSASSKAATNTTTNSTLLTITTNSTTSTATTTSTPSTTTVDPSNTTNSTPLTTTVDPTNSTTNSITTNTLLTTTVDPTTSTTTTVPTTSSIDPSSTTTSTSTTTVDPPTVLPLIDWSSGQGTLIDPMNSIVTNCVPTSKSWAIIYGAPCNSIGVNTSVLVEGDSSVSFTLVPAYDANSPYAGAIEKQTNINLNDASNLYFWFYINNASDLNNTPSGGYGVSLQLTNTNWNNWFSCDVFSSAIQSSYSPIRDGWNPIVIAKSACTTTNGASWSSNITAIEFRVQLNSPLNHNVILNIDNLRKNYGGGLFNKAQVILTFDGSWNSTLYNATPIMHANHQTGVAFLVTNEINDASHTDGCGTSSCITSNELTTLYNDGWDISSHTVDHANLVTKTADDGVVVDDGYQLDESYATLMNLGFTRSAKFLAYPNGAYNSTVIQESQGNYMAARALNFGITQPNMYPGDPYNLNYRIQSIVMTPNNDMSDASFVDFTNQVIGYTDNIIPQNGLLVLTFHIIQSNALTTSCETAGVCYPTALFAQISNTLKQDECKGLLQVTNFSTYYNVIQSGTGGNTRIPLWCNPALATPTLSPSVSALDVGQYETFTATITGGTSPYTYNWLVVNSVTNTVIYNALSTTNTLTFAVTSGMTSNSPLKANVIITDAYPTTANSIYSSTFTVKTAPTLSTPLPSNVVLNVGQSVTYNTILSNGQGPFTVNLMNGAIVVNTLTNQNDGAITFAANIPAQGSQTFNVIATDTGTTTPYVFNSVSNTIVVNPTLNSVSWTASNTPASYNQYQTLTATISGGTTPYTYNFLVYNATGSLVANILNSGIPTTTSNAFTFQQLPAWGTNTFTANIVITDSAAQQVSVTNTLTYTAQSTTTTSTTTSSTSTTTISQNNGGSSGVSSSGGSVGSGGSQLPTVLSQGQDCYSISNFTEKDAVTLPAIDGVIFHVVENFITPTSAGITINNQSITLVPNVTTEFITGDTASLTNISYIPILHTVRVLICPTASHQGGSPVQHNSTTTTVKTTVPTTVPTTTVAPTTTVVVVQHESASGQSSGGSSGLGMPMPLAGSLIAVAVAVAAGVAYARRPRTYRGHKQRR